MSKGRVLIVDDSELNRLVMSRMLDQMGWSGLEADGGAHALELLASESVDIVLMDCEMPDMSGFEATERLRASEAGSGAHVPVIAMTGSVDDETRLHCTTAGMDDFMGKPIDTDELESLLNRWMNS